MRGTACWDFSSSVYRLILRVKDLGFASFPINVVVAFYTYWDFRCGCMSSIFSSLFLPSYREWRILCSRGIGSILFRSLAVNDLVLNAGFPIVVVSLLLIHVQRDGGRAPANGFCLDSGVRPSVGTCSEFWSVHR